MCRRCAATKWYFLLACFEVCAHAYSVRNNEGFLGGRSRLRPEYNSNVSMIAVIGTSDHSHFLNRPRKCDLRPPVLRKCAVLSKWMKVRTIPNCRCISNRFAMEDRRIKMNVRPYDELPSNGDGRFVRPGQFRSIRQCLALSRRTSHYLDA